MRVAGLSLGVAALAVLGAWPPHGLVTGACAESAAPVTRGRARLPLAPALPLSVHCTNITHTQAAVGLSLTQTVGSRILLE